MCYFFCTFAANFKIMRRIIFIFLICFGAMLCAQNTLYSVPQTAVRELCVEMLRLYPAATLQDIYKTCYQDFFGAEHLMRDTAAARQYLHSEIAQCTNQDLSAMPLREPTGFRHRFVRINIQNITNGSMTEEELLTLFIEAAGKGNAYHDNWEAEWSQIETIALEEHPAWQNEELQHELRHASQLKAAVRHSDAFRNSYNPHYRIIRNEKP